MAEDRKAIEEAIQTYLDGLYEGDADKLAFVFHPTSALTSEHEGQVQILPRDAWLDAVRKRPSPQSKSLARADEILSIDQSSATSAFVKVKCQIPPRYFTDYLSLLKIDGRWVVVQKIFTARVEEAAAAANAA
ncbi:nuclear transport factor 2 family protein [Enterovirga rhinocerotis]|uniref:Putative lumazine-binding protein n=1 Tax=Enterovirga rhinocerotis TaxID=1339210 RepID=A0A4R7C4S5_9HYPH|nr:nuclear transport factor 2 family protein [Enterovirga rhinocerotis]TDR93023.1 putative lumazine-binding protein [Enterovirga rhinocerotis]